MYPPVAQSCRLRRLLCTPTIRPAPHGQSLLKHHSWGLATAPHYAFHCESPGPHSHLITSLRTNLLSYHSLPFKALTQLSSRTRPLSSTPAAAGLRCTCVVPSLFPEPHTPSSRSYRAFRTELKSFLGEEFPRSQRQGLLPLLPFTGGFTLSKPLIGHHTPLSRGVWLLLSPTRSHLNLPR